MESVRNDRERHYNYVFTTAIEGGINYWATVTDYRWSVADGQTEARDFYANILVLDDDANTYRIDREVIARGIRLALEWSDNPDSYHVKAFSDLYRGNWDDVDYDADTADMIVQFGLFGVLIYG